MYDNESIFKNEILTLKKDLENLRLGLLTKDTFSAAGVRTSIITVRLAPLLQEYIKIYGMPTQGIGLDSFRLEEILNDFKLIGKDPYNYPD